MGRNHLVEIAKERVCGDKSQRMICCPKELHPFKFLGEFTGNDEIGGEIYLLDKKTLVIKNFKYTGSAPKAYLIGGFKKFVPLDKDTRPNLENGQDVVLQFPYQGDAISKFDDPRLQDLGDDEFTFDGKRNLLLTLPQKKAENKDEKKKEKRSVDYLEERGIKQFKDDGGRRSLGYLEERGVGQVKDDGDSKDEDDGLNVSDLKWIMIWCNQAGVNLGHVILDNGGKTLFGDDNIENDIFS